MHRLLLPLVCCALPLTAEEESAPAQQSETPPQTPPTPLPPPAIVYFETGSDTAAISKALKPYRRVFPQGETKFVAVTSQCRTMHDAANAAKAVVAGVTEMPCLVLTDEAGEYAALPLRTLTEEALRQALPRAAAEDREEQAAARRYLAKEYLLFARMALAQPMDDAILALCLESCRALMDHPSARTEDRQLLGLRCLYPLLLEEYKRGYNGAHTAETEAKLLEAIAALETARDLDPQSTLGKQASAERERLRTARRQARQAE